MKICACICEYNPLHFGHVKHIEYIKHTLNAEKVIVIMSGNFTQRGEIAILNKFIRAKHTILSGADMVIELPSVFSLGNAETFAKGGVKSVIDTGICDGLCFGVESGKREDYLSLAEKLNDESKEFKKILKTYLDEGVSFAKAKFMAIKAMDENFDETLISSPNNILGVEYVRALLSFNTDMDFYPMLRTGNHNDKTLKKGITSATSIRETLKTGKVKQIKKSVPNYVYSDLIKKVTFGLPYDNFEKILMTSALTRKAEEMKDVPDCTEGLENRIQALIKSNSDYGVFISKATTKRYTESRIKRILTSSLLKIDEYLVKKALSSPLYLKVLAIKKEDTEFLSALSQKAKVPVITRKSDIGLLKGTAKDCFEIDALSNDIYNIVSTEHENNNQMILV